MEGQNTEKTRNIFLTEGRMVFVIISVSAGALFFIFNQVFSPIQSLKDEVANLRDNHLHTVEVKIDAMSASISEQAIQLAKLQTIMEERLPSKK